MAITDLLSKGSFPRLGARNGSAPPPDAETATAAGDMEMADMLFAGVPLPAAAHAVTPAVLAPPPRRRTGRDAGHRPLPSRAVLAIGALSLACVTLLAALVLTAAAPAADAFPTGVSDSIAPDARPASAPAVSETPSSANEARSAPTPPSSASSDGAGPVPAELLRQLEAAADAPLPVELGLFLRAVQHGFGTEGAELEPALRSYAYRLASRFEWNPDRYQIAVTAPDPALAEARAALLSRLFSTAVASGRLTVRPGVGAHALSLVTE